VVDASLAAILREIAQRMERDRQQQRKELARIARELRQLRRSPCLDAGSGAARGQPEI
jgi:hypothetical protein